MFKSSSENFEIEFEERKKTTGKLLPFGIPFLDDALLGIRPDDLLIVGAPSGVGKTQFCTTLALSAIGEGKRVHYFALEADQFEIERRLRFNYVANLFYADRTRQTLGRPVVYDEWESGFLIDQLSDLEADAQRYCESAFKNLNTFYKTGTFDVTHLVEQVLSVASETDLIIVDHVHYFDWSGQNDNEAMKEIARTARDLVNKFKIPMVLVAHLRKRDKHGADLVAGLDEFHGSSDLAKIATKAITISAGGPDPQGGGFITFMRCPKNRKGGGVTRFVGKLIFNDKTGSYEREYALGPSNKNTFEQYDDAQRPSWYGRTERRNLRHSDFGIS